MPAAEPVSPSWPIRPAPILRTLLSSASARAMASAARQRGVGALLSTTILGGSMLAAAPAIGQNIANPPVPFVNNGTINSVRFDDGSVHNAGGAAAVTNNGLINQIVSGSNGVISVTSDTQLLGSIVNSSSGSITASGLSSTGIGLSSFSSSSVTGDIRNDGSINVGTGSGTVGIHLLGNATLVAGLGGTGAIINNGSITSANTGIFVGGSVNAQANIAGGIRNTGTITTNAPTFSLGNPPNGFVGPISVQEAHITGGIRNDGTLTANFGGRHHHHRRYRQ
jgi:hypothetical protein